MIDTDPVASARRRRLALLVLAAGGVLIATSFAKDYPREQTLTFRVAETRATSLTATLTKVGESEARTGFTLALLPDRLRDVSHRVRLPDGDYIVTVDLEHAESSSDADRPAAAHETSVTRRVTLAGSEVVVAVPRVSE